MKAIVYAVEIKERNVDVHASISKHVLNKFDKEWEKRITTTFHRDGQYKAHLLAFM